MTQILKGISYKEVLATMDRYDVLGSVDKFTRILQWAQQRTLEWVAECEDAQRRALATGGKEEKEAALDRMVQNAEELGLYDESMCGCEACQPNTRLRTRMILCATCGNKRCPHATNHRLACTNSNEPGQPGSSYGIPLEAKC